jgi:hypothetical protein
MTAEIAILNKTAVALAADSAVTISAGSKEDKIFDTADKLFELSNHNAIGIMIYNNMSFMEAPLPSLIRAFRAQCDEANCVEDAAKGFLEFLHNFGKQAGERVRNDAVGAIISPFVHAVHNRAFARFQNKVMDDEQLEQDPRQLLEGFIDSELNRLDKILKVYDNAEFVGGKSIRFTKPRAEYLRKTIETYLPLSTDDQKDRMLQIVKSALGKAYVSSGKTGIIVAGFGAGDLFPTLVSYEIDGMIWDRLKFIQTNHIDIDRDGHKARVLPFAQKEMVERFLYGLDDGIQQNITTYCRESLPDIRKVMLKHVEFQDEEDRGSLEKKARRAESEFTKGLNKKAFDKIRTESQAEIEDMVEFMPKPEMAKMAEALVNLTSIKRRVSRGMETVGGPIDVAVISQSEGFVWVRRKHYFPAELNGRYFERMKTSVQKGSGVANA